jgi:hypothetical protein
MSQLKLLTHWSPTFIFMAQQSLVNLASNYSSHSAPARSDFVYYNTRDYPSAEKMARIICRELCFVMLTAPWGSCVPRWDEWRVLAIPKIFNPPNISRSGTMIYSSWRLGKGDSCWLVRDIWNDGVSNTEITVEFEYMMIMYCHLESTGNWWLIKRQGLLVWYVTGGFRMMRSLARHNPYVMLCRLRKTINIFDITNAKRMKLIYT